MHTVSQLRDNKATRLKWSLMMNVPEADLLYQTRNIHGNKKIDNLKSTGCLQTGGDTRKLRVLREAAESISMLEKITKFDYMQILDGLHHRRNTTNLSTVYPQVKDSEWKNVTVSDVKNALQKFPVFITNNCNFLHNKTNIQCARSIHEFLTKDGVKELYIQSFNEICRIQDWNFESDILNNIFDLLSNKQEQGESWYPSWYLFNVRAHYNFITHKEYKNIYSFVFLNLVSECLGYKSNWWASRKQWSRKHFSILEGATPAPVFHYFSSSHHSEGETNTTKLTNKLSYKISFVYNAEEIIDSDNKPIQIRFIESKENYTMKTLVDKHNVIIRPGSQPRYDYDFDCIIMPNIENFFGQTIEQSEMEYYSTLSHELIHWTGHRDRLNRQLGCYGDDRYSFEECVAELGSYILCKRLGLPRINKSAEYVSGWFQVISEEKRRFDVLVDALGQAAKACNYILKPLSDEEDPGERT